MKSSGKNSMEDKIGNMFLFNCTGNTYNIEECKKLLLVIGDSNSISLYEEALKMTDILKAGIKEMNIFDFFNYTCKAVLPVSEVYLNKLHKWSLAFISFNQLMLSVELINRLPKQSVDIDIGNNLYDKKKNTYRLIISSNPSPLSGKNLSPKESISKSRKSTMFNTSSNTANTNDKDIFKHKDFQNTKNQSNSNKELLKLKSVKVEIKYTDKELFSIFSKIKSERGRNPFLNGDKENNYDENIGKAVKYSNAIKNEDIFKEDFYKEFISLTPKKSLLLDCSNQRERTMTVYKSDNSILNLHNNYFNYKRLLNSRKISSINNYDYHHLQYSQTKQHAAKIFNS